jgi:purine-binding chemotaxis protein CheW
MSDGRQLCTFYVENLFLGIDVRDVQEVFRYQEMTPVPRGPRMVSGLINLRGQIVIAVDLRRRFELPGRADGQLPMNVVVRTDDGPLSLLVDEIGDVVEVDAATFEPAPATVEGATRDVVIGVHKFEGQLLMLLDTVKLIELADVAA